jgi:hypothetical protein
MRTRTSALRTAVVAAVAASALAASGSAAGAAGDLAASQSDELGHGGWVQTYASTYKTTLYATTTVHNGGPEALTACVAVRFLDADGNPLAETPAHQIVAEPGQADPVETWYAVADWDVVQRSASLRIVQNRC